MFKWSAFPFIRVSLCLAFGILAFDHYPAFWNHLEVWLAGGFCFLMISWFVGKHSYVHGALCLFFIVFLGGCLASVSDGSSRSTHYTKQFRVDGFVGTVVSDNIEKKDFQRYDLRLHFGKKDTTQFTLSGKIYLYVRKGENDLLAYGDVVSVSESYFPIAAPANPHEFDYRSYLKRQHVYAHAFVDDESVRIIGYEPENVIRAFAYRIRSYAKDRLNEFVTYERERAILTALLLGIKDHLDNDLNTSYAAAGAMHVLAVSGLHVGIIYIALLFLLKPIKEKKWGMLFFVVVSVSVIWIYALVTGFSPSVMRAATMFTVIIISDGFKRKANIYNSLGVAACILIVYDPNMIYAVGFQLSFAAVFGIVKLYPRLYRIFEFDFRIADYFWSITCVSIAAQIATFPLTLLYFHQLPTYFLISNLVIIPAATVMLGTGILMLLVGSIFPMAGKFIGFYFQQGVWLINEAVGYVKELPQPVFDWLYFDTWDTLLVYMILIFLVIGLSRFSYQDLSMAGISMLLFFIWLHVKDYRQYQNQRIIFYEVGDMIALDLIDGKQAVLLADHWTSQSDDLIAYQVDPNRLANGLLPVRKSMQLISESDLVYQHTAYDLIEWNGLRIMLVREMEGYELQNQVRADIVFLAHPQNIALEKFKASKFILGSGFNYYDVQKLLDIYGNEIDLHSLSQDGFWELDLSQTKNVENGSRTLFSKR